jgi:hypothetical protein
MRSRQPHEVGGFMLEGDDLFIWLFVEKYYHQKLNTPQDTVYHQFSVLKSN